MSSLQLRPRFKKSVEFKSSEFIERVKDYLGNPDCGVTGTTIDNHVILSILPEEQHYWSPQLSLEIVEEGRGAVIKGLYGPHPKVWTMFMFLYTGFGFIALIGLMYGLVQWSLNIVPLALWFALAAVLLEITFYFIARTGKQLAHGQMLLLQDELNNILK